MNPYTLLEAANRTYTLRCRTRGAPYSLVGESCATARAAARLLGFFDSTNNIGCGGIKGVKSVLCQAYSVGSEDNV